MHLPLLVDIETDAAVGTGFAIVVLFIVGSSRSAAFDES